MSNSSFQDVQAEVDVLRGMARWSGHREIAVAELQPTDFSTPEYAALFEFLRSAHTAGDDVHVSDLRQQLSRHKLFDSWGDKAEAAVDHVVTQKASQPVARAIQAVRNAALNRQLHHTAQQILEGLGEGADPSQLAEAVEKTFAQAPFRAPGDHDVETLSQILQPTLDQMTDETINKQVRTGFEDIDRLLNGLRPGQLVVIGGAAGMGKSVLALNVIRQCVFNSQIPAALFTRQVSKVDVTMQLLSAETRVPLHVLRSGNLSDDDYTRLAKRMRDISEGALFVDDQTRSVEELRLKALRLKRDYDVGLIVVDSIQRFYPGRWDRYREAAGITRMLKDLAMELQVPVLAVSSLNRDLHQRPDKRPQLQDLRDSGTVEEDADVVILVHRESHYDSESRPGEADLIVAKHRLGATDTAVAAAQLHLSRFMDIIV